MTDTLPRTTASARAADGHRTGGDRNTILTWADGRMLRNGQPHQVLSGAVHYFRVHPDLWRDRIRRVVDLGLNTLDTYIAWNFHQPHENSAPDFRGWRDVERFVAIAGDEGLDVVIRPGPYICAEWANGGLPTWLTRRDIALRSSDPGFTDAVDAWFDQLLPRIAALQAHQGGPVVAVQIENEFGSFGDDQTYLRWNHDALVSRGITELLFTADGPTELMLDGGTLPGTLAAITLGSRAAEARDLQRTRRPGEPFVVAEYWNGWFDHWGEQHHVRTVDSAVSSMRAIVDDGGSVSLYMAHGGTNFGLWAGANEEDGNLQPTVTSYDSDAPIAEDGTLTAKFHAMRAALGRTEPIRVSARPTLVPPTVLELDHHADVLSGLQVVAGSPYCQTRPATFEDVGLDSGLMLHSARPRVPHGEHRLVLTSVHDRASVYADGALLGVVEGPGGTLPISGTGARVQLDIVVESLGRINYGPHLGAAKGLLGPVLVDRRTVQGWGNTPVALQDWTSATLGQTERAAAPRTDAGFASGTLDLDVPADTHLAFPGSVKGFVWVNGFLLGRYWDLGPQRTLYCPAPLLRAGRNRLDVLELHHLGSVIELRATPELGPPQEYVEQF